MSVACAANKFNICVHRTYKTENAERCVDIPFTVRELDDSYEITIPMKNIRHTTSFITVCKNREIVLSFDVPKKCPCPTVDCDTNELTARPTIDK